MCHLGSDGLILFSLTVVGIYFNLRLFCRNEQFWVCSDSRLIPRLSDAFRPSLQVALSVPTSTWPPHATESLKDLRDTIPAPNFEDIKCWRPDPDLILVDSKQRRWKQLYAEGEKLLSRYYEELSKAIRLDAEWEEAGECVMPHSQWLMCVFTHQQVSDIILCFS